jgi:hypothetical protein
MGGHLIVMLASLLGMASIRFSVARVAGIRRR